MLCHSSFLNDWTTGAMLTGKSTDTRSDVQEMISEQEQRHPVHSECAADLKSPAGVV